ncbi:MAG: (d)CMP kinase [Candidatus Tectomicrobia bacterium]|nr:(d)CMP kinase [Candidatus Tectomicrobia bacterium]
MVPLKKKLIIAIDGPGGTGKSSVGKLVAQRLHYLHIESGMFYRAVALKARRGGIRFTDEAALEKLSASLRLQFQQNGDGNLRVLMDDEDITMALREEESGRGASEVAKIGGVRSALLKVFRQMGEQGGLVMDGRDVGTVIFPNADLKIYLDASVEERSKRRVEQLRRLGKTGEMSAILHDLRKRDDEDATREISPLKRADDAIYIDTTTLSIEEVVLRITKEISKKL